MCGALFPKVSFVAFPHTTPALARALSERAYTDPTEVQTAVLAPGAEGRDLLVSAQTGSGKTLAFGLSIAVTCLDGAETLARADTPMALVVAPTRELALQVQRELTWLYQYIGAKIVSCVGGMDPRAERRELNFGCHIVVGTPGRLRDHLERGSLRVGNLKAVVLDEADEMLDLGFREDLEFILEATPKERRTLLFSATMPRDIANLAKSYQNDALRIQASGEKRAHADIEYRAMRIAPQDNVHAVVNIVRFIDSPATIVFCNTRDGVRHLHATLVERGFSAVSLSGEFSQEERNHALQALRDGRARICVATDVAARGIDLPNLGLVIHADLPNDAETLQHRSGRTGRAGRKGVSVLLVTPSIHRKAERLLGQANIKAAWVNPPSPDAIRQIDNERLLQSVLTAEAGEADDLELAKHLLAQRSAEEIAAALVRSYRARLPAPEDLMDTGMPERREPKSGLASGQWFRLNVGRDRKADPKWLIPEICRQGGITKREIGAIRIFDDETKFEIATEVAEKFAARTGKLSKGDIQITPSDAPAGGGHVRRTTPKSGDFKKKWRKDDEGGRKTWKPKGEFKQRDGEFKPKGDWKAKGDFKPKSDFKPKGDFKQKGEFKPKGEWKAKGEFKHAPKQGEHSGEPRERADRPDRDKPLGKNHGKPKWAAHGKAAHAKSGKDGLKLDRKFQKRPK
ncbi:MAG: DEAD/DEAH box helicase [Rhodospirillaceae bacterium]|nr:DEAD/DEAH box helicase [Rhodospirillaceae bacterium]